MIASNRRFRKLVDKLLDINRTDINVLVVVVLSTMLGLVMFGENVKAQWWVVDDHEIAYFLGSDHVLRFNEIPDTLIHETEIGQYLNYPRFRPVYYILRLGETLVWRNRPGLWYALRTGIFILFIGFFWYLISKKVGRVIGGFLSFYMATSLYWTDIVGRLGPSEIYATLGLMLFGAGVYIVYRSNKIIGWWGMFIGVVICSGSKENFLFLFLPLVGFLWLFYNKGKINITRAALSLASFMWMIWIGYVVVVSTRLSEGGDVYGNSVGLRARLLVMINLFGRFDVIVLLLICVLLLFSKELFRINNTSVISYAREAGLVALMLSLIYISQIFFYGGDWPVGIRYDFPGLLVWPILFAVILSFFQKTAQVGRVKVYEDVVMFAGILVTFILSVSHVGNIYQARLRSIENVAKTAKFTQNMEMLASLGIHNPNDILIIQADNPAWDYEPVFSYARFIRFYGAENKLSFLWVGRKPENYNNRLNSSLAKDLSDLSLHGVEPAGLNGKGNDFIPISEADAPNAKCILIVISGTPKKNCSQTIVSNWR